jgi:hypothetical protein
MILASTERKIEGKRKPKKHKRRHIWTKIHNITDTREKTNKDQLALKIFHTYKTI